MTRTTHYLPAALLATLIVIACIPSAAVPAEADASVIAPAQEARAEAMQRADEATRDGRLNEAERIYRAILTDTEGDTAARLALGRLHLRLARHDDAIDAFEGVLALRDTAPAAHLLEARTLLDHAHALRTEEWHQALAAGDADLTAAFVFARRLVNTRRHEAARQLLQILVDESPEDAQLHYWLSQALIGLGDHEHGIGHLERSTRLAPDNLQLRFELGGAYEVAGALDQAEALYETLVGRVSGDLLAQTRARLAYVRAQRAHDTGAAGADAALRAALELNPDSIALRLSLAEIHDRSGRVDEAIALLEEAARLARTPDQAGATRARLDTLYLRHADHLTDLAVRGEARVVDVLPLAQRLVLRGLHEAAVDLLEPAAALHPDDPQIRFWLGRSHMGLGDVERGVAAIERSVQLAPPNPVLLLELGHAYRDAGRLSEAEETYHEVIAQTGNLALKEEARRHGLSAGAVRAEQDGDPATALARYELLLETHPDDPALRLARARLLLALGRHEESDAVIDALLTAAPADRPLRLRLAQLYMGAGRDDRAMRMYEEILQLDPSDHAVAIDLGRVQLAAGDVDAAFSRFKGVIEDARQRPDPRLARLIEALTGELLAQGTALAQDGDLAAAEAFFTRLIDLTPRDPQVHYASSRVYQALGDHERQAQHLARVVALAPENPMMRRRLALAWIDAGRPAQARDLLVELVETFPHDSEIRLSLARVLAGQGESERARAEYARVVDLNPAGEWRRRALDALGFARARERLAAGDGAGAAEIAQALLAIAAADPDIHRIHAQALHQAGRHEQADQAYREVLRLAPGDPDARLGLARLHAGTGRADEAVALYHALATGEPALAQSAVARHELDRLLADRAQARLARAKAQPTPGDRDDLLALGIEAFDLDGHAAAGAIFEHLLDAAPDDPEPRYWLGRLSAALDRPADAIVLLRRSVDMRPGEPRYLEGLALAYRDADLIGPAIDALEQAVASAPRDAALRLGLADLYHRADATDLARHQYAQVLVRSDEGAAITQALEGLELPLDPALIADTDLEGALTHFRLVPAGTLPPAPAARLYLAAILHRLGHHDDAATVLRSITADEPAHFAASLHLAGLDLETGHEDRAIRTLEALSGEAAPPAVRREARIRLIEVLEARAGRLATALRQGEDGVDAVAARELGTTLVRMGHPLQAIPLLEALTGHTPGDPQAWYWLGRANALGGRYAQAIAPLQTSVTLAPENPLLRYELGLALQRADHLSSAESEFRTVARHTDDPVLRRDAQRLAAQVRGRRLVLAGDIETALAEYRQALALAPEDVELLGESARLAMLLGRFDEAEAPLTRASTVAPENAGIRLQLAEMHRLRGEPGRAVQQLAQVIARSPGTTEAVRARSLLGFDRGVALIEAGEPDEAQIIFERLLDLVPDDVETRFQLGRTRFLQRRLADAEDLLTALIAAHPAHQEAHLLLGRLYEVLDRRDDAIHAYERTLDIDTGSQAGREALPLLATLYSRRFQAMIDEGRPGDAVALLERLIASAPENAAARMNLARLYLQSDRDDLALRELRAVIAMHPDDAAAHRLVGMIHAGRGRHREATHAYADAIAADDDPERAQATAIELILSVAHLMIEENRPFAAVRHLQDLTDPAAGPGRDDERAHSMLGAIYRQQGRLDEAARAFAEAVRIAPDNVRIRFSLAEIHERRNYEDLALIQHREIVRRGAPGDRFVEESRRRAERLRDRLALFSSNLRYAVTIGESVIQEQDLDRTGALNSSFSSQLFYNLGTNFRPTRNTSLRIDTGMIYIANHSTRDDLLIPRLGIAGGLRFPAHFYSASAHVSELRDLMRDRAGGRTVNLNLSGGIRFSDPWVLFRRAPAAAQPERGERRIERAPERQLGPDGGIDNPALHEALRERYVTRLSGAALDAQGDDEEWDGDRAVDASSGTMEVEEGMRLYRSGWRSMRQGRLDEARAQFEAVLALVPDDYLTLLALGTVHQGLQDGPAAERTWLRALEAGTETGTDTSLARLRLAGWHAAAGRTDEAIALLEAGHATDAPARVQEAIADLLDELTAKRGAEDGDPERITAEAARLSEALDFIADGRYGRAQTILEDILDAHPGDLLATLNMGVVHQRQGRLTEAETEFQRVLDRDPRNLNAALRLGMVYAASRRPDLAITLLHRVASEGAGQETGARAASELERLERQRLGTLTGAAIRPDPVERTLQGRYFYTDTTLPGESLTESYSQGVGISLASTSVRRGGWVLDYTWGTRRNEHPLGTDYAYDWHEAGLTYRTPVPNPRGLFGNAGHIAGLTAVLGVNWQRRSYREPDTNAVNELGESRRRTHDSLTFTAGLNYQIPRYERFSYFLTYTTSRSRTNLPVGLVYRPDGEPVAFQSSGLGAVDNNFVSVGINFRF